MANSVSDNVARLIWYRENKHKYCVGHLSDSIQELANQIQNWISKLLDDEFFEIHITPQRYFSESYVGFILGDKNYNMWFQYKMHISQIRRTEETERNWSWLMDFGKQDRILTYLIQEIITEEQKRRNAKTI